LGIVVQRVIVVGESFLVLIIAFVVDPTIFQVIIDLEFTFVGDAPMTGRTPIVRESCVGIDTRVVLNSIGIDIRVVVNPFIVREYVEFNLVKRIDGVGGRLVMLICTLGGRCWFATCAQ